MKTILTLVKLFIRKGNNYLSFKLLSSGDVLRWRRNRMGRPLSPSQIHQKNISMLSKLHTTTSECWQRISGTQKSRSLSSKTGRKKHKRQKKRQRRLGGSSVPGRESHPRKGILSRGFQTLGNILPAESVASLGSTEGNITGRKNK